MSSTLPRPSAARLADGQWHRLHPASPLLRGGFVVLAILGIVLGNLRERVLGLFLPRFGDDQGDPVDYIVDHGYIVQALVVIAVVLVVLLVVFWISWRMHSFRITDEVVEVRSGVLIRTNRKARLDRIQAITMNRPLFARLFGAAKLEISQAGHDANVQLSYLGSSQADELRREILHLASGAREAGPAAPARTGGMLDRRIAELLAPELDPSAAAPESIVRIHLGRLLGSMLLGRGTVLAVLVFAAVVVWMIVADHYFLLVFAFPSAVGFVSFFLRRFAKSVRYSIAGTPDGVRVGFGLLSTSNETLPPGRIHSLEVSQSLLWRPAGWWEIRLNKASHGADREQRETGALLLPVGTIDEVRRVLDLVLPELVGDDAVGFVENGLTARGGDGFVNSPRRAFWLRPLSWRRNGFAITRGGFVLRKGALWRRLIIVPQPRLQSVGLRQGPLDRALGLASVHLHTVAGPIRAELGAVDQDEAARFFGEVSEVAVSAGRRDSSHRWRAGEEPV